ncbi:MAG: hypothetical protein IIT48_00410 [Lachnospiraceae bacterium]|nr:hypothetical protein [Lachnospiraceae bacterium]
MTSANKSRFVLIIMGILMVILSPIVAKYICDNLLAGGDGGMLPFYIELFTSLMWVMEIIIIFVFYKFVLRYNIFGSPGEKGYELPFKRLLTITIIVSACIVIISAQINFKVKPFYDLGDKFNGYQLYYHLGVFLRNIIKSIWIVILIKAITEFVETVRNRKYNIYPFAGIILMGTLGVADMVFKVNNLSVSFLLLYIVYGWLYLLTERNYLKTVLLVMFLIIF